MMMIYLFSAWNAISIGLVAFTMGLLFGVGALLVIEYAKTATEQIRQQRDRFEKPGTDSFKKGNKRKDINTELNNKRHESN